MGVLCVLLLLFLCRPSDSASFFRGENPLNREDAQSYCATKGASLASILSQDDYDTATTACSGHSCWIGLLQKNAWEWDNKAPVTNFGFDWGVPIAGVSPWAADQPRSTAYYIVPGRAHPLKSRTEWVCTEADAMNTSITVSCCALDGSDCERKVAQAVEGATFDGCAPPLDWVATEALCASVGRRLCTADELTEGTSAALANQGICSQEGCGADQLTAWSSKSCGDSFASDVCVTLEEDGFRSRECDENVHYPLCSRAKWIVLLDHKDTTSGYFDPLLLYFGLENHWDPTANTFSIIGDLTRQDNGEYLRNDGLFYFKLDWTTVENVDLYGDASITSPVIWSQSTWLTESEASGVTEYAPELGGDFDGVRVCDEDFGSYAYLCCDTAGECVIGATRNEPDAEPDNCINTCPGNQGVATFPGKWAGSQTLSVYMDVDPSDLAAIAVTACNDWTHEVLGTWTHDAYGTGQLSIMVRGTEGSTPFISVNQVTFPNGTLGMPVGDPFFDWKLPENGNMAIFEVDADLLDVGTVLGVTLDANDDDDGICIQALSIISSTTTCRGEQGSCYFGSSYFGSGIVLKSVGKCDTPFVDGRTPMLPCYDDGILDLSTTMTRGVVDLSIHSCNLENGGMSSNGDLSVVLTGKSSMGSTFISSKAVPLTFGDKEWAQNTYRHFQLNVDVPVEKLAVVQLYGGSDSLCVDVMSANGHSAMYFSENWIGGASNEPYADYLMAVFQYPVCATEVIDMRVVTDTSTAELLDGESIISGLECSNYNRILPSTCSISQSYETSKTTSFSFVEESSTEESSSRDYMWGTDSSQSTSKDFSFGMSRSLTVGAETGIEVFGAKATVSMEVSVETNQQFTHTSESTNGQNQEVSTGSETSTGSSTSSENSWESTSTASITCEASMDVAPSHSVSYSLIFNAFNATLRTETDFKLTLCSAMFRAEGEESPDDYVFLDDIPGTITHKEVTGCEVQFDPAEYLRNEVECAEEEKLAIAAGATYIPRCVSGDGAKYEACQCDIGDSRTMGVCWCSDEKGNPTDTNVRQFDGETDTEVCAQLACSGGNNAVVQGEVGDGGELQTMETQEELESSEALEPSIDIEALNDLLPLLDNLLTAALITLVLTSGAIAVYVANKCVQWISHGKQSQRTVGKTAPPMKEQELTDMSVVEASQETV